MYKCPKCNNEINIGTENKRLCYTIEELKAKITQFKGTTNYCVLCEQAGRKIETTIMLLKSENCTKELKIQLALSTLEEK